MKLMRKVLAQRKYIKKLFVKNKNVAIISNNCVGAAIAGDFALRYNSPTMNLQISPLEFTKFCKNVEHYMDMPLTEVEKASEYQKDLIRDMYGCGFVPDFPLGMVGDITIFFQHYSSFELAKKDWDRRKSRVKIENCIFIFVEKFTDKYQAALKEFDEWTMDKNRKLVILTNCGETCENCVNNIVTAPEKVHIMDYKNTFSKYYQNGFSYLKFINGVKI